MTLIATYDIPPGILARDYHGAGKAWAAVRDGKVIALRYMGEHRPEIGTLPAWVREVRTHAEGLDNHMLPTAWSSHGLSKLAQAAETAADCPRRPKGGQYRPRELLTMARAAIAAADSASFAAYRERIRKELAAMGDVVSGMCSCTQFVVVQH